MIDAFNDVPVIPFPENSGKIAGSNYLDDIAAMQVGRGSRVMRMDQSGIWLGAETFAEAPFSVDMDGNLVAVTASLGQYLTKTGTSQAFTGSINVMNNRLLMDGINGRIVSNDGTTNRVVLGDV